MPRRIVDISVALKAGIASDPPYMLPPLSQTWDTAREAIVVPPQVQQPLPRAIRVSFRTSLELMRKSQSLDPTISSDRRSRPVGA